MDRIAELLARLNAFLGLGEDEQPPADIEPLSDEELAELDEAIREEAASPDELTLEEITQLADAAEAVRNEQAARTEAAAEEDRLRAEQLARITPPESEEETPDPEASDTPDEGDEGEPVEEPAEEPAEAPAEEPEPEAVAAATPPARRRVPQNLRPRPRTPAEPQAVIVAAGDIPGFSAGNPIPSVEALGHAFADKADRLAFGQSVNVATIRQPDLPEARTLRERDSAEANQGKIDAVVAALSTASMDELVGFFNGEPDALVAAGGLCAPSQPRYEMMTVSTARRPIRDSLVRFGADRGAVNFIAPPVIQDLDAAVSIWTEANDTTPGSAGPTTKPCLTITCGSATTVEIDAITLCLRVGNFSRRTFPEQFAAWFGLAQAQHAREAENRLWDRMCSLSTAVTAGAATDATHILGAARDILVDVARAAAALRQRHRTARDAPVEVWFPEVALDIMQADLTRQLPGDNAINVAKAEIEGYLRARNILPVFSPDSGGGADFGAETGGVLQGWPTTIEVIVAFPGSFLFVDGGTLDLGTEIRDSTLIGTNDVQAFMETFENVAFVGPQALCMTINVCPSGATAATEDTSNICVTGS